MFVSLVKLHLIHLHVFGQHHLMLSSFLWFCDHFQCQKIFLYNPFNQNHTRLTSPSYCLSEILLCLHLEMIFSQGIEF